MPELWTNGIIIESNKINFSIDLSNRGETAQLIEFRLKSDDIALNNEHLPFDLLKDESRWIYGSSINDKSIYECNYSIYVIYMDKIKTRYELEIQPTKKGLPVIVENKEIKD